LKKQRQRKRKPGDPAPTSTLVKPVRPTLRRTVLRDCTAEAVAPILRDNPRGICVARPELDAWIAGMNQYKGCKGNDRQICLEVWDGTQASVDRKSTHKEGPLVVPHPCAGVLGGITPKTLPAVRESLPGRPEPGQESAGFVERI